VIAEGRDESGVEEVEGDARSAERNKASSTA